VTSVMVSLICSKLSCLELCVHERRIKTKKKPTVVAVYKCAAFVVGQHEQEAVEGI